MPRRKLWQDTAQKLGRLYANCITPFSVSFIGEAGVDAGGAQREFFSLLFDDCKKHLFATGDGRSFTLLHDVEKVRNGEFRLLGNLISIALLYDCAGPRCFTPSVTARLLNGPEIRPTIQEIPDIEVQEKLAALVTAKDDEEFQSRMATFEERFSLGVTRFKVPYAEREDLSRNIAQHFWISVCNEEIQEVRKGMEVLGVLKVLEDHYNESKNEFNLPAIQKDSSILALFTNIEYTKVKERDVLDRGKKIWKKTYFIISLTV